MGRFLVWGCIMRVRGFSIILLALAVGLLGVIGCDKKGEEAVKPEAEEVVEAVEEVEIEVAVPEPKGVPEAVEEIKTILIDEGRPLGEIRAEAADMNDASLRAAALGYRERIFAKQVELADVMSGYDEFPYTDIFGRETLEPAPNVVDLTSSISALRERHHIYFDTLKERGGDVSGLGL